LQPHLFDYLYDLSASDGADQTRAADAGSDPARNGEPFGELGLVTQHDDAWQDQTGGPADPQPGNHNGKRDVVDSATFESGSTAGFTADAGSTGVQGKYLVVKATPGGADGASLFYIDQRIGEVFDVETTLKASLPKDGLSSSNAFVLFDYDSAESFKFAGFDALSGQLQIGRRTAEGWQVLASVAAPIAPGHDYAVTLNVEDGQVLLRAADRSLSYTFSLPGVPLERLGDGQVGVGARDAAALASSYTVLAPPWPITLSATEAFTFGTPARFHGGTGQWTAFDGRYTGMPEAGSGYAVRFDGALPPVGVNQAAMIELDAMLSASELGGFVFDAHGDRDFKFAALLPSAGQVVLGHRRDQDGWVIDMVAAVTLQPGIDHRLTVKLEGTGVGISVDGELRIQHAYTTSPVDGRIGLLGGLGGATFDWVGVRTNDPALQASSDGTNQAPDAQADGSDGIVDFNQTYTASGDPTSAGTTGTAGTAGSAGTTGTDGGTTFGGPALGGLRGGLAWGERTATRADGGTTRTVPLRLDVSNWLIDIDDLEGER